MQGRDWIARIWRAIERRPGFAAVVTGVVLAAGASVVIYGAFSALEASQRASRWEIHTVQVQLEGERLLTALIDAESAQRGYLLTGDPAFLAQHAEATDDARGRVAALRVLTADNPQQQRAVDNVDASMTARLARLDVVLLEAQRGGREAAFGLVSSGVGAQLMGRLRADIAALQLEEARLLAARRASAAAAQQAVFRSAVALAAFAAVLLLLVAYGVRASTILARRERIASQQAAIDARVRTELQERVEQATAELRASEAQLRQVQKMEAVGQLAGGIAHDFNNMLAIIVGSLEMMQRRLAAGERDVGRFIDGALDGARRAADLTRRLLAFSRRQPLSPNVLNINRLVSDMSELLRRSLGEDIELENVNAGGLWATKIDAGQLENAILNLAVNARDAMPGGGKLTIETANAHLDDAYAAQHAEVSAGQYVMVAVSDTGSGMEPQVIERAFEPFFTTKEFGRGTGLGLSQVFGFVKQSGGHIKIYSELGRGTTVKLYLPRWLGGEEESALGGASGAEAPKGRAEEVILVVEDDERVGAVSVEALRELGYDVHHANSARGALALLDSGLSITLLFTDVVMPEMNGRQLADAVTARYPDVKVLFTTGYTRNAVVHNGVLDPDVELLQKPYTHLDLALKVRRLLDRG